MAASHETLECTRIAAEAARQLKATDITAIDVSERLVLTEAFLVVSGSSQRQVRALVDGIEEALAKVGIERERREGFGEEIHWVLVDFGDLIVHVLPDEDREFYALDRLWGDCPAIDVGEGEGPRLEDDGEPGVETPADSGGFDGVAEAVAGVEP
ncbi:MAG: ribosome silencing factor [Actinomycetaceae bacterium]|nr:ribosome silencing factor [Actinomycetaceae bacterium]